VTLTVRTARVSLPLAFAYVVLEDVLAVWSQGSSQVAPHGVRLNAVWILEQLFLNGAIFVVIQGAMLASLEGRPVEFRALVAFPFRNAVSIMYIAGRYCGLGLAASAIVVVSALAPFAFWERGMASLALLVAAVVAGVVVVSIVSASWLATAISLTKLQLESVVRFRWLRMLLGRKSSPSIRKTGLLAVGFSAALQATMIALAAGVFSVSRDHALLLLAITCPLALLTAYWPAFNLQFYRSVLAPEAGTDEPAAGTLLAAHAR
jgi:hypothetical protein